VQPNFFCERRTNLVTHNLYYIMRRARDAHECLCVLLLLLLLVQVGQTGTELQSLLERPPLVRANSIQVQIHF
jgi:hypothetical protein